MMIQCVDAPVMLGGSGAGFCGSVLCRRLPIFHFETAPIINKLCNPETEFIFVPLIMVYWQMFDCSRPLKLEIKSIDK